MRSFLSRLPRLGLLALLLPSAALADIVRNDRLGVATHFSHGGHYVANYDIETTMPIIAELGVGWIRDELGWGRYERAKGVYALPERTRQWVDAANRAGLKILLIFNYGNDLYEDRYDPDAYAKAAAHLARELRGKIHAIEVLNEPNNFGFGKYYGGAWNGMPKDGEPAAYVVRYTQLLNRAAVAIKAANPALKVIGCGAPAPANYRMISLGIVPAVDGIVDHPYSSRNRPEIVPFRGNADFMKRDGVLVADEKGTFASLVRMYREHSARHKGPREIWLTEWGFSTFQPKEQKGSFGGVNEDAQAKYALRRFAESLGLGVEMSVYYDLKDDGRDPHDPENNFGLLAFGPDPRRKPAFAAIQRFARFTEPYRVASSPPAIKIIAPPSHASVWPIPKAPADEPADPDSVRAYAFEHRNAGAGETMFLVWSTEPAGGDLNPRGAAIELVWPRATPVRSVSAHDFFTGETTELPFELDGTKLRIPRLSLLDRPVALVLSR